jgi:hypothetical protein
MYDYVTTCYDTHTQMTHSAQQPAGRPALKQVSSIYLHVTELQTKSNTERHLIPSYFHIQRSAVFNFTMLITSQSRNTPTEAQGEEDV